VLKYNSVNKIDWEKRKENSELLSYVSPVLFSFRINLLILWISSSEKIRLTKKGDFKTMKGTDENCPKKCRHTRDGDIASDTTPDRSRGLIKC